VSAWFNGVSVAHADPWLSRALHYGDGVFRTCLNMHGQIIDIDMHADIASADAERLQIQVPPHRLKQALALAGDIDKAILKLLVSRQPAGRGYAGEGSEADILVTRHAAPSWPIAHWQQGITADISTVALAAQPLLAGIKHLNRLEQVLAARALQISGEDEALCLDQDGNLVCGTRSNLFWVRNGRLFTPRLDRCGVMGLMRRKIINIAGDALSLPVDEVRAAADALADCDEIFVCNAVIGIWPVRRLGSRILVVGPVTRALQDRLDHPQLSARN
jgi:4-amino-4-deoxychorismate lyase